LNQFSPDSIQVEKAYIKHVACLNKRITREKNDGGRIGNRSFTTPYFLLLLLQLTIFKKLN